MSDDQFLEKAPLAAQREEALQDTLLACGIRRDEPLWGLKNFVELCFKELAQETKEVTTRFDSISEQMRRLANHNINLIKSEMREFETERGREIVKFRQAIDRAEGSLRDSSEKLSEDTEKLQNAALARIDLAANSLQEKAESLSDRKLRIEDTLFHNWANDVKDAVNTRLDQEAEINSKRLNDEFENNRSRQWTIASFVGVSILLGLALGSIGTHLYYAEHVADMIPDDVQIYQTFRNLDASTAAVWKRLFSLNDPFTLISNCKPSVVRTQDGQQHSECQVNLFLQ